jgi:DNA-binding CsgD family transcriptional regulator
MNPHHPLTPKEHETWQLHIRGMSTRAIALALNVSRSTIRSRLENATRKHAQQTRSTNT